MKIRSLTPDEAKARGRPLGSLAKIRAHHHMVARLYAKGHKPPEIARFLNRTPATIRNWIDTPACAELVAQYAEGYETEVTNELEYRASLRRQASTLALEKLVEDLEGDLISSHRTLLALADSSDDRTGLGKMETKVNVNVGIGSKLDQARERRDKVISTRVEGNVVKLDRRF